MSYETSKKAQEYYSVSYETLRNWAIQGKLKFTKTEGGHRRYYIPIRTTPSRESFIYARVSSSKQKNELENQIDYLKIKYPNHKLIKDIGSGINFKRKGFLSLLDKICNSEVKEVVVASKDRLARFGFELLQHISQKFGCKLTIISKQKQNPTKELSEDLMSIITVFTARYYGLRSYSKNQNRTNLPNLKSKKRI